MVSLKQAFVYGAGAAGLAVAAWAAADYNASLPRDCHPTSDTIAIDPDYRETTLPPNLAPPNFAVAHEGRRFTVDIRPPHGPGLHLRSRSPCIVIPRGAWRKILGVNRGESLSVTVSIKHASGAWNVYRPFRIIIATEPIDPWCAFRIIKPIYVRGEDVGIWQRDLESYRTRELAHGRTFGYGCVNCHTFLNQDPNRMILGTRSRKYHNAALVAGPDRAVKLGVKFGYPVWHPGGTFITYVDFDVFEFLHSARSEYLDVFDMRSCIAQYDLAAGTVTRMPDLMGPRVLETYPAWSPDGRTLYFCSAPMLWDSLNTVPPENYDKVRYSLCRIAYDPARNAWGTADTVLSAQKTGMSILQPRVSPDGRFILFCMCDYSVFPTYQKSSDLYILDLSTKSCRRLACNSSEAESWHSWSSSGRWIAFSSKRDDGEFTRTYISYIDSQGNARKPFLIPQKNPAFYKSFLRAMNVPEFITGPVRISERKLGAAAMQGRCRGAGQ
jgi:hypothetical protein